MIIFLNFIRTFLSRNKFDLACTVFGRQTHEIFDKYVPIRNESKHVQIIQEQLDCAVKFLQ